MRDEIHKNLEHLTTWGSDKRCNNERNWSQREDRMCLTRCQIPSHSRHSESPIDESGGLYHTEGDAELQVSHASQASQSPLQCINGNNSPGWYDLPDLLVVVLWPICQKREHPSPWIWAESPECWYLPPCCIYTSLFSRFLTSIQSQIHYLPHMWYCRSSDLSLPSLSPESPFETHEVLSETLSSAHWQPDSDDYSLFTQLSHTESPPKSDHFGVVLIDSFQSDSLYTPQSHLHQGETQAHLLESTSYGCLSLSMSHLPLILKQ